MATPDFLQDYAKDYAAQAKGAYSVPIDTTQFTGRQFVAGEDPLQTQAIGIAQGGVGAYKPYLSAAQQAQTDASTTLGGLGSMQAGAQGFQTGAANVASGAAGMTGANAYQPFMSPYQQQVIDATLSEFDKSRLSGQQNIRDAAVNSGNFGGGREGAMMGQYNADSLADRAALQGTMLNQGFTQANQLAQQNFQNQDNLFNQQQNLFGNQGQLMQNQLGIANAQAGLGQAQLGLSNFERSGLGADVGALGQLGSLRQGLTQGQLTADQQAAQTAAYEPYGRLSQYGQGLTGLSGGVASQQYAPQQEISPMSQAVGTALGVGGLYGKIFGFPGDN
jgi:hypothetical protein